MTKQKKCLHLLLALVLTFFIISGSVIATLSFRPLYYHDIRALDIEAMSGFSEAEIRENYDALIDYNMRWEKGILEFPTLPQSREGQIHFAEVKDIFDLFKYLGIGSFCWEWRELFGLSEKRERLYLKYTSIMSVALPAVVGALVAVNWDSAFVLFHKIAFDNDYWLFDPASDPVITMLPDEFFLHCALMILGGIVLGSLVCGFIYRFRGQKKVLGVIYMGLLEKLFKKETEETNVQERILEIVAVTGPEGVSGIRNPEKMLWTASIALTAWRLCDTTAPVREEVRRLSMEADEERLKWMQRMIKKDSVVRLRVREVAGGFELEDVLESFCTDAEMREICAKQQEPVYYEDPVLGSFRLNKAASAYEQILSRSGMEVRLLFDEDEESRMKLALETLQILTSNLDFWEESAGNYAVSQLLELKNENWLSEGESEMTAELFLASIWLNDIQAMQGGKFRFWYNDGGMFGGHAVYVDGNVYGRFLGAGVE